MTPAGRLVKTLDADGLATARATGLAAGAPGVVGRFVAEVPGIVAAGGADVPGALGVVAPTPFVLAGAATALVGIFLATSAAAAKSPDPM